MQVEAFVQQLKAITRYITDLPFAGAQPPMLNTTQIKNIVYKAMPATWQQHFIQSNRGISAVTLLKLHNFMSNKRTFSDSTMKNVENDQQEISIVTGMSNNAGETTQFVVSTADTLGDNATIIHVDKAFVPQEVLVATQTDMDAMTFVDAMTSVHLHHIRPINKVVETITTINNSNPM
jgi:hypothetical protein